MKTTIFFITLFAVAGVSGCNRSAAETAHEHEHTPAATYREGHGLQLSERGAQFVALKTADVSSRTVGPAINVAAIPADALLRTVKGDFVYVANGDWFLRTPIKVGSSDNGWLEVSEGLYEGDEIAVSGVKALWLAEVHAVNGGVSCAHGH
jgi:hypothetical protein